MVYARADRQWMVSVEVEAGATVQRAIECSGLLDQAPELRTGALDVGLFHRPCPLDTAVQPGDRIEIHRPLLVDPKQARRVRAARGSGSR